MSYDLDMANSFIYFSCNKWQNESNDERQLIQLKGVSYTGGSEGKIKSAKASNTFIHRAISLWCLRFFIKGWISVYSLCTSMRT